MNYCEPKPCLALSHKKMPIFQPSCPKPDQFLSHKTYTVASVILTPPPVSIRPQPFPSPPLPPYLLLHKKTMTTTSVLLTWKCTDNVDFKSRKGKQKKCMMKKVTEVLERWSAERVRRYVDTVSAREAHLRNLNICFFKMNNSVHH